MSDEFLAAARAYVARGWRVIRLKPSNGDGKTFKHPLETGWTQLPMPDDATLVSWWGDGNPNHYGIGIVCGIDSGIVCVDIDPKNGGDPSIADAYDTPTQRTGTGGLHLIFQYPDRPTGNWVQFTGKGKGVDLRTDAGQFVAAPTVNDNGTAYKWLKPASKFPTLPCPDWVKERENEDGGVAKGYADTGFIEKGEWNSKMTSIAGMEARHSHSRDELRARLQTVSDVRSRPEDRGMTEKDIDWLDGLATRAWDQWRSEKVYRRNEEGQAEFFADAHADDARFNWTTQQWMVFTRHWWEPDMGGKVRSWVAKAHTDRIVQAEAAYKKLRDSAPAGLMGKDLTKWIAEHDVNGVGAELAFANEMGSYRAQEAVWRLIRKQLGASKIDWDMNPRLIGVENGVVDLTTGELREGDRGDMISKHINLIYDASAVCVRWERFISEIFGGDAEMIEFFQRIIGYAITGLSTEDKWFLCYGTGGNGKSTALQKILLRHVLGPYGMYARVDSFTQRMNRSSIPNDIAEMEGKRFVVTSEPKTNEKWDEERLKSLSTGGRQRARKLQEQEKEFTAILKLFVETNYLIDVDDDTNGFWRRVLCIPFLFVFDPQTEPDLEETLIGEAQGILAWAVRGSVKFFGTPRGQDKLATPESVKKTTAEYRQLADRIANWVNTCIDLESQDVTGTTDLMKSYNAWLDTEGVPEKYHISNERKFHNRLISRFADRKVHTEKGNGWRLKLKKQNPPTY